MEKLLISINNKNGVIDPIQQKIISHQQKLQKAITIMRIFKQKVKIIEFPYVLTHGDGHYYNILQTNSKLSLVDWQNPKLAPIERDLWHYVDYTTLMDAYGKLNSNFINQELCLFYKIQRFLEDIRFYAEQENTSIEQQTENVNDFLNHWGWNINLTF